MSAEDTEQTSRQTDSAVNQRLRLVGYISLSNSCFHGDMIPQPEDVIGLLLPRSRPITVQILNLSSDTFFFKEWGDSVQWWLVKSMDVLSVFSTEY